MTDPPTPFSTVTGARAAITAMHKARLWEPPCFHTHREYFATLFDGLQKRCAATKPHQCTGSAFTFEQASRLINFGQRTPPTNLAYDIAQRNATIAIIQFATGARADEALNATPASFISRADLRGYDWVCNDSKTGPITRLLPVMIGQGPRLFFRLPNSNRSCTKPNRWGRCSSPSQLAAHGRCRKVLRPHSAMTRGSTPSAQLSPRLLALPELTPKDFGTHAFRRGITSELAARARG